MTAQAYVLPGPARRLTFIELILKTAVDATGGVNIAYCAARRGPTTPQTEI